MRHLLWFRAGKRRADFQGLHTGVDVEASTQLLRSSGPSQVHLGLLRSIISGGVVCGQRASRAGFSSSQFCEFCHMRTEESVQHLFWECPAWKEVRTKHALATASWRPDWPACLSCCGVLCDQAVILTPPPSESPVPGPLPATGPVVLHLDECFVSGRVEVYTDGACVHNQIPSLRRAGVGAWWADNHPMNVSVPLEGHTQTNNRAELSAVLHVLKHEPRDVHIKTDSEYVLQGCLRHRFT